MSFFISPTFFFQVDSIEARAESKESCFLRRIGTSCRRWEIASLWMRRRVVSSWFASIPFDWGTISDILLFGWRIGSRCLVCSCTLEFMRFHQKYGGMGKYRSAYIFKEVCLSMHMYVSTFSTWSFRSCFLSKSEENGITAFGVFGYVSNL